MEEVIQWDLVIVVPCYNEAKGLRESDFLNFLQDHPKVMLCFVNDGSKDSTLEQLNALQQRCPMPQVSILDRPQNQGKAAAVRAGMLYCQETFKTPHMAYLDADLATPLEECIRLSKSLSPEIVFVFGSRICRLGVKVQRKRFRFIIGRMVATAISLTLHLKVYDTQCGCKVFESELVSHLFKEAFISKWLFDMELFFRLLQYYQKDRIVLVQHALEIPLNTWIDRGDSKVSFGYGFKLWWDLFKIKQHYKF